MIFDIDKWKEIQAYLRKNKLRTFLTMLGVACGIFILVTLLGLGEGFNNAMRAQISDAASNSAFFWCNKTTKPYKGLPAGRDYNFHNRDMHILKERIPGIAYIAPEVRGWGGNGDYNTVYEDKRGNFSVQGASPDFFVINPVSVLSGRNLTIRDVENKLKVAVIGPRVREVLFDPEEEAVGKYVRVNGMYVLIVGVVKPENNSFGNKKNALFMPYTTLQQIYGYGDRVWSFMVALHPEVDVETVEKEVLAIISSQHKIAPDDYQAIGRVNVADIFEKISAFFKTITVLLWVIGMGTLIIGAIGVSNIMLVVVRERTKEIGIKRAIGATPHNIIKQILFETIALTAFAGFWGFVLGVAIVEGVNVFAEKAGGVSAGIPLLNPHVDFHIALVALGILLLFGSLAGLLPAQRAISVKPIEALKED
ncbi:MAG: ABC transporter ATP-binding protein [Bacteroidetes bacterium]|nr:MAG: ABC transporter ATP-binding protein [Bacteroidota bacterium]